MKMVEFTRDMRPYVAGETRVVPDDVAQKLVSDGDATPRASVFDKAEAPAAGALKSAGRYKTRKAG